MILGQLSDPSGLFYTKLFAEHFVGRHKFSRWALKNQAHLIVLDLLGFQSCNQRAQGRLVTILDLWDSKSNAIS